MKFRICPFEHSPVTIAGMWNSSRAIRTKKNHEANLSEESIQSATRQPQDSTGYSHRVVMQSQKMEPLALWERKKAENWCSSKATGLVLGRKLLTSGFNAALDRGPTNLVSICLKVVDTCRPAAAQNRRKRGRGQFAQRFAPGSRISTGATDNVASCKAK